MPLQPGSVLVDRYRIEDKLGRGGMGAVYLAYDLTLNLRVAVKENLNANPESEKKFKKEAELLAKLHHPHLARVTNYFIRGDQQYLVMDYIEGVDLHARAAQKPPMVDEVISWAKDLGSALTYLHNQPKPIIHRDIKPSNVKLQPDGTLFLVDFGIAKIFEHDQAATTTGARGLTPGFSPPEQYGGARTDDRSDEFSLAATLYALLTGRPPAAIILGLFGGERAEPSPTTVILAAVTTAVPPTPVPLPTDTPSPTFTPEPSPTPTLEPQPGGGGRIAFVSDREDGRTLQIWTMLPDGSDPAQLTFGPGDKTQPEWSPNGERLLFVGPGVLDAFGTDLGLDIFATIPGSGFPPQNLTQSPGDDFDPAWAPNGTAIAFTRTRNNDTELVHIMFIECPPAPDACVPQEPQRITMTGTFAPESDPAWSPDSGQLAVIAKIRGALGRIYVGGFMGGGAVFDRSDRVIRAHDLALSPHPPPLF